MNCHKCNTELHGRPLRSITFTEDFVYEVEEGGLLRKHEEYYCEDCFKKICNEANALKEDFREYDL